MSDLQGNLEGISLISREETSKVKRPVPPGLPPSRRVSVYGPEIVLPIRMLPPDLPSGSHK